jgi:hypothetical protein
MEQAGSPRAQLLAMFDALSEWFSRPEFRSCMFIKAASEYPDPRHPIHAQSAEHKRCCSFSCRRLLPMPERMTPLRWRALCCC